MNGRGELIGLAFDGNWEAMTGDLAYDPDLKRCINVDIRYVLFCVDKLGGAKHLVDEMTVVNKGPNPGVGATAAATSSQVDGAGEAGKMKTKSPAAGKVKIKKKKNKEKAEATAEM
nr:S46 family peptidase [Hymenobacter qilianensis]